MAYKHLTINELIWIEKYYEINESVTKIAKKLKRARQTIYNIINWLKRELRIQQYYTSYKKIKNVVEQRRNHFLRKKLNM